MAALSNAGADVIGVNCALGPLEMEGVVRDLSEKCPTYISCSPNAGLPSDVDGKVVFPLGPEEYLPYAVKFYDSSGNGQGYGDWVWLPEDKVPWSEDLRGEALGEIVKSLAVVLRSQITKGV